MANETYPLAMPDDLLKEVRAVAEKTHLSIADAMRQSIRLGLPKLAEQLEANPLAGLKPFTKEECLKAWGPDTDGDENDRIGAAMCKVVLPRE